MKKILFFTPDMKGGGAQRTVLNVVNYLDREKLKPILVMLSAKGPYIDLIRKDVEVVELGTLRVRSSINRLAKVIRSMQPDLVFSTLLYPNIASVIATLLSCQKIPVIIRETNNFTAAEYRASLLTGHAIKWAYHKAQSIVALSQGVKLDLLKRYALDSDKVKVIYNPVDLKSIKRLAMEKPPTGLLATHGCKKCFEIIAVGKLHRQKGFDLLIEAMNELRGLPIRLMILGEGDERSFLEKKTKELDLRGRVLLPGFVKNPYSWIANADLLILSSRWEGFGHVIVEAMACGTPVLSTRCPSGPDEIITDGFDGKLCEPGSVASLVEGIRYMIDNPEKCKIMAHNAIGTVEHFDAERIVREYEGLFLDLLKNWTWKG